MCSHTSALLTNDGHVCVEKKEEERKHERELAIFFFHSMNGWLLLNRERQRERRTKQRDHNSQESIDDGNLVIRRNSDARQRVRVSKFISDVTAQMSPPCQIVF
jgi:hypothetical protein